MQQYLISEEKVENMCKILHLMTQCDFDPIRCWFNEKYFFFENSLIVADDILSDGTK